MDAKAPDFELLNEDLKPVRLSEVDETGRGVVVLPGGIHVGVSAQRQNGFAEVLAISVDSPFALKRQTD